MVTGSGALTLVERLARFAARASYDDLSKAAREHLKIRVLDALACAIGALDGSTVVFVKNLDNSTVAGAWTVVTNTVTTNLSGKTLRIQAESSNDYFYPTSFYFDSLSLKATHCP